MAKVPRTDREIMGWFYPLAMPLIWTAELAGWWADRRTRRRGEDADL